MERSGIGMRLFVHLKITTIIENGIDHMFFAICYLGFPMKL
jgi:hypothetical protein